MKFTNPLKDKPYRKWHRIAYYILLLGCGLLSASLMAAAAWGEDSSPSSILGTAAIVCVIVFYAINMIKWRCPNCHRPLPLLGPVINCRYCKRSFMDSKGNQIW